MGEAAGGPFFVPLDEQVQRAAIGILREHPRLVGVGGKRNGADPFVIALAKIGRGKVVTEERSRGGKSPKIPDVCEALNIPCLTLVQFVEEQDWEF